MATSYIITILLTAVIMVAVGYVLDSRGKNTTADESAALTDQIRTLTAERDVQRANADNCRQQLATQKDDYEQRLLNVKAEAETRLKQQQENAETRLKQQQAEAEAYRKAEQQHSADTLADMRRTYDTQLAELKDAQEKQVAELKASHERQIAQLKDAQEKQLQQSNDSMEAQVAELKASHERQIAQLKDAQEKQLQQSKDSMAAQIDALKLMNKEQVESQMKLIREQMQTTSEEVLKRRQDELGERNREQVSKILDPLQQSFREMQEAFNLSKSQQSEALTRLDETIKINMQKSTELGETADRLTRALTGEVKVQGNFGELKLKQLLEDMDLKEGEQFDTQETLRDKAGRSAKGDDGKGLIPDFILHFPNNRHVVVDSKMSLTDYERYMNAEDGTEEKTTALKAHIASVRAQVKRLARKEYTKYLPSGYNRLNFAIMYVPIEGALNLALLNDGSLWREAYDQGVLILGPQTMYMNLRVLEMMWTQVRQLKNQQAMMDAANIIIERVQDFGMRFMDVEAGMNDTIKKMAKLKITTADSGPSIITAAKRLLTAGAKENKKKKSLDEMDEPMFIEGDKETDKEGDKEGDKETDKETDKEADKE
jgi:DNA recombination protein RmuC